MWPLDTTGREATSGGKETNRNVLNYLKYQEGGGGEEVHSPSQNNWDLKLDFEKAQWDRRAQTQDLNKYHPSIFSHVCSTSIKISHFHVM